MNAKRAKALRKAMRKIMPGAPDKFYPERGTTVNGKPSPIILEGCRRAMYQRFKAL